MLAVNKHREILLEQFYLDSDDITVRRKKDGWGNRYKAHDVVKGFRQNARGAGDYLGVHIPRTRATVQVSHLIALLRGVDIPDNAVLDHMDGNPENNHRDNVRVTAQHINCKNRAMRKDNKLGYSGMRYDSKAKLYIIRKTVKGERLYSSAKTFEEAVKIYETYRLLQLQDGYTERNGK